MKNDPIVLFCSPRGGSSLVAGIIRAHGVWVGRTFKGTDYENHENADIKDFLKTHWKMTPGIPMGPADKADLYHFCKSFIKHDDPWMFKVAVEYYPIFKGWFPHMTSVMVYRDRQNAIEGLVKRKGLNTRAEMTKHVNARYDYMDELMIAEPMAVAVSSDDVMEGDCDAIAEILSRYNIEFDRDVAAATLRPGIWTG